MANIAVLPPILRCPPEILHSILVLLDPIDVAAFSRTCSAAHTFCLDAHLWACLFLTLFDPPAPASSSVSLSALTKERVHAREIVTAAREHDQLDRVVFAHQSALATFLDLAASATSATSRNVQFLSQIFPATSTAFAGEYIATYLESPSVALAPEARMHAARFHFLHGPTWRSFEKARMVRALRRVYRSGSYGKGATFGPFVHEGAWPVNWLLVDGLRTVMDCNVRQAVADSAWGRSEDGVDLCVPGSAGWADSAPGPAMANPDDWAGVESDWVGTYAYLDWDIFEILNTHGRQPVSQLQLSDFREAVGDLMQLSLTLDAPARSPCPEEPFPPLAFTGTLSARHPAGGTAATTGPSLRLVGTVMRNPADNATKWSFTVRYGHVIQWALSGIQVGEPRSRLGVVGVWSHAQRLVEGADEATGPCGPFWWWPAVPLDQV